MTDKTLPPRALTMRSEAEMLQLILGYAAAHEDIRAVVLNGSRANPNIRKDWLQSATFPLATFVPTRIEGLPDTHAPGQALTFTITGDMTVRDVTAPVTWQVTARLNGEMLKGEAKTVIKMSLFGFEAPSVLNVLRAEDDAALTLAFVAAPTE